MHTPARSTSWRGPRSRPDKHVPSSRRTNLAEVQHQQAGLQGDGQLDVAVQREAALRQPLLLRHEGERKLSPRRALGLRQMGEYFSCLRSPATALATSAAASARERRPARRVSQTSDTSASLSTNGRKAAWRLALRPLSGDSFPLEH